MVAVLDVRQVAAEHVAVIAQSFAQAFALIRAKGDAVTNAQDAAITAQDRVLRAVPEDVGMDAQDVLLDAKQVVLTYARGRVVNRAVLVATVRLVRAAIAPQHAKEDAELDVLGAIPIALVDVEMGAPAIVSIHVRADAQAHALVGARVRAREAVPAVPALVLAGVLAVVQGLVNRVAPETVQAAARDAVLDAAALARAVPAVPAAPPPALATATPRARTGAVLAVPGLPQAPAPDVRAHAAGHAERDVPSPARRPARRIVLGTAQANASARRRQSSYSIERKMRHGKEDRKSRR